MAKPAEVQLRSGWLEADVLRAQARLREWHGDKWLEKQRQADRDYQAEVLKARQRKRADAEVLLGELIRDGLSDDQVSHRMREAGY